MTSYPATPGHKGAGASYDAAKAMQAKAAAIREKVMACLARGDYTPDECAAEIGEDRHSVRSRFSELVAQGKIFKLDQLHRNQSGFSAHVHTINPQGELI